MDGKVIIFRGQSIYFCQGDGPTEIGLGEFTNPEIISSSGEKEFDEGCLSVPGAYDKVIRAEKVTVKALDRFGKPFEMSAEGLLAECFQHEIDHLNGKLFVDFLSPLKRAMARRKLDKFKRHQAKS
jgi:peptide deformylase